MNNHWKNEAISDGYSVKVERFHAKVLKEGISIEDYIRSMLVRSYFGIADPCGSALLLIPVMGTHDRAFPDRSLKSPGECSHPRTGASRIESQR